MDSTGLDDGAPGRDGGGGDDVPVMVTLAESTRPAIRCINNYYGTFISRVAIVI